MIVMVDCGIEKAREIPALRSELFLFHPIGIGIFIEREQAIFPLVIKL